MNTVTDAVAEHGVLIARSPQGLERIGTDGFELALWQRQLDPDLARWLNSLPAAALPRLRVELPVVGCALALHAACDASGTPCGPLRDAFVDDVAVLARRFARVSHRVQPEGADLLKLRLDVVDDNACRRWHRDCVPLRLLCTYRGPGTDWVLPADSQRALAAPNDDASPVQCMRTHEVAVFKGCGFAESSQVVRHDVGIVHRSPRIAGSGVTRLVLCVEPVAPTR